MSKTSNKNKIVIAELDKTIDISNVSSNDSVVYEVPEPIEVKTKNVEATVLVLGKEKKTRTKKVETEKEVLDYMKKKLSDLGYKPDSVIVKKGKLDIPVSLDNVYIKELPTFHLEGMVRTMTSNINTVTFVPEQEHEVVNERLKAFILFTNTQTSTDREVDSDVLDDTHESDIFSSNLPTSKNDVDALFRLFDF